MSADLARYFEYLDELHGDAEKALENWMLSTLDFPLPCEMRDHGCSNTATWVCHATCCTTTRLSCESCRELHFTLAAIIGQKGPYECIGCKTEHPNTDFSFFSPLDGGRHE